MTAFFDQVSSIWWSVVNHPRVLDFLDIAILAVVIFLVLTGLRRTRASQSLKGLAVLLVATWFVNLVGMRTLSTLLTWVINAGPVLVVVLYQKEIRRFLENIGTSEMFEPSNSESNELSPDTIVDEMVMVLQHMSRRRVGALIVIEDRVRLTDVVATGTVIDGLISQPLIENIFEPNTPLHDGAMIVRGDRIVAASCLLRLSDTTGVGRDLGTRHRAGIGVSEISDARVLIVSEETGIISMAYGGRLVRHLDEPTLRKILHNLYDREDKPNSIRLKLGRKKKLKKGGESHDEPKAD